MPETTGDEDAVGGADFVPGFVIVRGRRLRGLGFEMGGVHPYEVKPLSASHGGVFERFDDGEV